MKKEDPFSIAGRTERSQKKFFSQNDPIVNPNTKIAVLIDGGSASTSEIVAGNIQDLDRGISIIHHLERIVQTVFPIDNDRTSKITANIPSGRLIQKKVILMIALKCSMFKMILYLLH